MTRVKQKVKKLRNFSTLIEERKEWERHRHGEKPKNILGDKKKREKKS
jgi:hypothetical protein